MVVVVADVCDGFGHAAALCRMKPDIPVGQVLRSPKQRAVHRPSTHPIRKKKSCYIFYFVYIIPKCLRVSLSYMLYIKIVKYR